MTKFKFKHGEPDYTWHFLLQRQPDGCFYVLQHWPYTPTKAQLDVFKINEGQLILVNPVNILEP